MKTKIKLINKTKWNTIQIRKLCNTILQRFGGSKKHIITIKTHSYSRMCPEKCYGGFASVGGNWITMKVPKIEYDKITFGEDGTKSIHKIPVEFDNTRFAQVLEHELGHNYGLRHDTMCSSTELEVEYAKQIIVTPMKKKEKKIINIKEMRKQKAICKAKELEQKIKRMNNLLKKYQKKIKYYEKVV